MTRPETPRPPSSDRPSASPSAAGGGARAAARAAAANALSLASRVATRLADPAGTRATKPAAEEIALVPFARGSQPHVDIPPIPAEALPPEPEPPPPAAVAEPARPAAPVERVSWVDYLLIGLAIVSLLLLVAEQVIPIYVADASSVLYWLVVADLAICGVFAIEFFARMRGQPNKWAYTKSRWYDVLGMIPVSHPMFRGFRLVRIIRIVVITSRLVRATNRSFGEMLVESTVRRFRDTLVDVIGGAVVVRGVEMVQPWLVRARFAERIGDAMEAKRSDIHRMVQESMRKLPGGRVLGVAPMRGVVERAETAAVQAVIDVLRSDELNRVVQQSTANVLEELRASIAPPPPPPPRAP